MLKVIIAGSREFDNYNLLCEKCDNILSLQKDVEIVSGCAYGADKLGEKYAIEKGFPIKHFPANWKQYGKKAGYLRNKEMAEYADALIAFWDQQSRGTKSMIQLAKSNDLKIRVITF